MVRQPNHIIGLEINLDEECVLLQHKGENYMRFAPDECEYIKENGSSLDFGPATKTNSDQVKTQIHLVFGCCHEWEFIGRVEFGTFDRD